MIIYKATNRLTGKMYIGQTTKTLEHRKLTHIRAAESGGNYYFHNAIHKYGADNFRWQVICICPNIDSLNECEQYYIALYNSMDGGYNSTSGGKNHVYSDMSREKMSKTKLGHSVSKKTRKKLSRAFSGKNHPMYGKHLSEKTKRKISDAQKGEKGFMYRKHLSEETRRKIGMASLGRPKSKETIEKLSKANKGKNNPMFGRHHSKEARNKMSKNNVGMKDKHHTKSTKKKMVIAQQKRRIREKMFNSPIIQLSLFKS